MRSDRLYDPQKTAAILDELFSMEPVPVRLMEVCGTHTMAIAKAGIKRMLPPWVKLCSGPGCPVCVTPPEVMDAVLRLSGHPDVILATYGDMIRVPGSVPGDHLIRRRAAGAKVEVVYSPMEAVALAQKTEKQVVFLGVGFETTAPGTAATILAAKEAGVHNFSVYSMLKRVKPALLALWDDPGFQIDGLLCPGHVATILGEAGFRFLPEELHLPSVISGFEPEDILESVLLLLRQIRKGSPRLENTYTRAVLPEGNPLAVRMMESVFTPRDDLWRGLGEIPQSGLALRAEFAEYDAEKRFDLTLKPVTQNTACRCGEVIRGKINPEQCPLFGKRCRPEDPVGPCMVSGEGACAAAYKYQGVQ